MELNKNQNIEPLWDYADVAAYTKQSQQTWRKYVMNGECPYIKIGKSVRFDPQEIKAWLNIEVISHDEKQEEKSVDNLSKAVEWLKQATENQNYGEVSIKLIIHDGCIKRIERTITEKVM